ncbi:MAG: DUF4340 domain-containing protein [Spirochaetales bacterium]|nr:DUF4340 domain-containing protein [Spirochaetales bacterium]
MKNKKDIYILAGIIILLFSYIIFRQDNNINYVLPKTETIKAEDITKIEFNGFDLNKTDEKWILPSGYKASPTAMDRIIAGITNFQLIDMISQSKDYQRFGLDTPKELKVKNGDKDLLSIKIGNTSNTGNYTYVLVPGDDNVYSVRGDLSELFNKSEDSLRDKTVIAVNNINKIELIKDQNEVELSADQISTLAPVLKDLQALTFEDVERNEQLLALNITGDSHSSLIIYNKVGNSYPATSSEVDFPFTLPEYIVTKFLNIQNETK